jgi:hypothetical protein
MKNAVSGYLMGECDMKETIRALEPDEEDLEEDLEEDEEPTTTEESTP